MIRYRAYRNNTTVNNEISRVRDVKRWIDVAIIIVRLAIVIHVFISHVTGEITENDIRDGKTTYGQIICVPMDPGGHRMFSNLDSVDSVRFNYRSRALWTTFEIRNYLRRVCTT